MELKVTILAIIGYCLRHQEQGKHIVTTAIEHHAVLETIDYLVQHFGFEATIIQPENQEITAQQIQEALRDDTILVSPCLPIMRQETYCPLLNWPNTQATPSRLSC